MLRRRRVASIPARGVLAFVLAASIAPAASPAPAEPVDLATLQRIRDEGLHRSQVMETLAHLTDVIGPRLTGSPQMKAANEWTRARLAGWGLDGARLEAWGPFGPGWTLEHVFARVLTPSPMPLLAWPRAWSPATDGVVRGKALVAQLESEADFAAWKGKLAGHVVLIGKPAEVKPLDQPPFKRLSDAELADLARMEVAGLRADRMGRFRQRRRFGAALHRFLAAERPLATLEASSGDAGVITVGGVGLRGKDDPRGVPQLVVVAEQYNRLLRLAQGGHELELELEVRASFHDQDLMAYNTLAEIPGSGPKKDEVVLLGAHLDSWHAATGATDNAAGSAVVMEAVRILRAVGARPRRTIRVALWSGEEQGLLGSRAHVRARYATRPEATDDDPQRGPVQPLPDHGRLAAYFNLDGGTGRIRGVLTQENVAVAPIFAAWIQPLSDLGVTTVSPRRDFGSDHNSFDGVGLPAFNFIQDDIEYDALTHHTHLDHYDRAHREDLVQAAVVVATFAWQAAQRDEPLPRKPLPPPNPPAAPAGPASAPAAQR